MLLTATQTSWFSCPDKAGGPRFRQGSNQRNLLPLPKASCIPCSPLLFAFGLQKEKTEKMNKIVSSQVRNALMFWPILLRLFLKLQKHNGTYNFLTSKWTLSSACNFIQSRDVMSCNEQPLELKAILWTFWRDQTQELMITLTITRLTYCMTNSAPAKQIIATAMIEATITRPLLWEMKKESCNEKRKCFHPHTHKTSKLLAFILGKKIYFVSIFKGKTYKTRHQQHCDQDSTLTLSQLWHSGK